MGAKASVVRMRHAYDLLCGLLMYAKVPIYISEIAPEDIRGTEIPSDLGLQATNSLCRPIIHVLAAL